MSKKELSIIIVNYNTKEHLKNCLDSIIENTKELDCEIITIDNASSDGSVEMLEKEFSATKLILNKENVGFSRANNQGIEIAKGTNVLLLNSDTIVLNNSIYKTLDFINSNPKIGIVGCRVLNSDRTLQHTCYHYPNLLTETIFFILKIIIKIWDPFTYYKYMYYWNHKEIRKVECVAGCFMLVKKKVFEKVGLLDGNLFIYYEDSEFCRRVNEKSNYEVYYYPKVEIIHIKGTSCDPSNYDTVKYCYESAKYYLNKYYGSPIGRLFNLLCKLTWQFELLFFYLFTSNRKFNKKISMLKELLSI